MTRLAPVALALALSACAVAPSGDGTAGPSPASAPDDAGDGRLRGAVTPLGIAIAVGLSGEDEDDARVARAATVAAAASVIVGRLNSVWRECEAQTRPEYYIDCLSEGYVRASGAIPGDATFTDSRAAILQAAGRLRGLAEANRAPDLPPLGGGARSRALTPVDPARLAAAQAQARAIIEETETVLLRSGERSADRRVAYRRISQALGTGKQLLRSA